MAGNKGEIFERIEKKYLLTQQQYQALQQSIQSYMKIDAYGKSTICNVYYDTEDFELIRSSIEKPVYKEKLRVRSYGTPGETDLVYIELKKKYDGVVYKRRIAVPMREARQYLHHGIHPRADVNPQILKEIDYFQSFYQTKPKMYIAYDRIATYGIEDSSIRITYDSNIRAREQDMDLTLGSAGHLLFKEQEVLMEIKVSGAYPLWLSHLLAEHQIYPTSFSKYGSFYKRKIEKENRKLCLPA